MLFRYRLYFVVVSVHTNSGKLLIKIDAAWYEHVGKYAV